MEDMGYVLSEKKHENHFLVPSKPLNQQDVDFDGVFIFCTRVFIPSPPISKQPDYLTFLFAESQDAIVNGRWLVEREQATKLAALYMQYHYGDHNARIHNSNFYNEKLRHMVPEEYRSPPIIPKILQEHQRLTGTPPSDAGFRYLEAVRLLPSFGDTFFKIKVISESVAHHDLLRINYSGISHLESDTLRPFAEWPLSALKSWGVDSKGDQLTLNLSDGAFVCLSPNALIIDKLLGDTINLEVARTKKPKPTDKGTETCLVM